MKTKNLFDLPIVQEILKELCHCSYTESGNRFCSACKHPAHIENECYYDPVTGKNLLEM